eukprot:UN1621
MKKSNVPMIRVVRQASGRVVTLDNRRLAVYKMVALAGKCSKIKVSVVPLDKVEGELRRRSDSRVEGLSVTVRGTDKTVHADGSVTSAPKLTDGQLQQRADIGGHWTVEQHSHIKDAIHDFDAVIKRVLGQSASLKPAGSYLKGTDVAEESDIDVMVFGPSPVSPQQWNQIADGIKSRGYEVEAICPRCIHVTGKWGCMKIEFDVVANQARGYPPNKEPENPFRDNRVAARAVRNIKMDFKESGDAKVSGHLIEQTVLTEQRSMSPVTLEKLIDAAKAALRSDMAQKRKRQRTA